MPGLSDVAEGFAAAAQQAPKLSEAVVRGQNVERVREVRRREDEAYNSLMKELEGNRKAQDRLYTEVMGDETLLPEEKAGVFRPDETRKLQLYVDSVNSAYEKKKVRLDEERRLGIKKETERGISELQAGEGFREQRLGGVSPGRLALPKVQSAARLFPTERQTSGLAYQRFAEQTKFDQKSHVDKSIKDLQTRLRSAQKAGQQSVSQSVQNELDAIEGLKDTKKTFASKADYDTELGKWQETVAGAGGGFVQPLATKKPKKTEDAGAWIGTELGRVNKDLAKAKDMGNAEQQKLAEKKIALLNTMLKNPPATTAEAKRKMGLLSFVKD